jgi:hypothetical protein
MRPLIVDLRVMCNLVSRGLTNILTRELRILSS